MKTSFFLTALCILSLSAFLLWSKFEHNNNDISISVNDDVRLYKFAAEYPDANTHRVEEYLNRNLAPGNLFKSKNDHFDANVTLNDETHFYIMETPGELKIEFNKVKNSTASLYRIKKICEGIKMVLTEKN